VSLHHLTEPQLVEVADALTRHANAALDAGKIEVAEAFNKAREIHHKAQMRAGDARSVARRQRRTRTQSQPK